MFGFLDGIIPGWVLWLAGWVPFWVWIALAAMAAGAILRYVRVVGWQGALAAAIALISLGALGATYRRGREDREKEGANNVKKVMDEARKARERVRDDLADGSKLRDDDGYRRGE